MDLQAQRAKAKAAGYSDQEIDSFLSQRTATQQATAAQQRLQASKAKKPSGIKGFITSQLPTIGGAAGAMIGSLVPIPGLGTAVGGALGSGLGEFARQKLMGEKTNVASLGVQAGLGAVPGMFKGLKAAGGAIKGAKTAANVANATEDVATAYKAANVPKVAGGLGSVGLKGAASKRIPVTFKDAGTMAKVGAPTTTTTTKYAVNPTIGELADTVATPGTTGKLGIIKTPGGSYGTPYVKTTTTSTKVPVSTPETYSTSKQALPGYANAEPLATAKPVAAPKPTTVTTTEPVSVTATEAPKQGFKVSSGYTAKENILGRVGRPTGGGQQYTHANRNADWEWLNNGSKKYVKGGIKVGTPEKTAARAEFARKQVEKNLDSGLSKINRPTTPDDITKIGSSIDDIVSKEPMITTAKTPTLDKLRAKVSSAKSIEELEQIRREADDIAYTLNGAGKTSSAAQAKSVRKAIDKYISDLSPEYKAIKGDWVSAKNAERATLHQSNSARGATVFGMQAFRQGMTGVKAKAGQIAAGKTGAEVATKATEAAAKNPIGFRPFLKATGGQVMTRAAAAPLMPETPVDQQTLADQKILDDYIAQYGQQQPGVVDTTGAGAPQTTEQTTPQATGPFQDPVKVQQAYLAALAGGDTKAAAAILEAYNVFGAGAATAEQKPLSAEASKVISNANSGLTSLAQLESTISESGGVPKATLAPGRGLFGGVGANALGVAGYDSAAKNVADVITRLRTGAAITESEEAFYKSQLPQAFDSPEVIQQKLNMFRELFTSVANRTGTAGTDMQAATGGAQ